MDSQRFDAITKYVARGLTRRQAMKAVLGGAVAGTLGQFVGGHVVEGKGKPCAHDCDCPDNQKCANNHCTKACPYTSVYCRGNVGGYTVKGICIARDDVPLLCANMGVSPGESCALTRRRALLVGGWTTLSNEVQAVEDRGQGWGDALSLVPLANNSNYPAPRAGLDRPGASSASIARIEAPGATARPAAPAQLGHHRQHPPLPGDYRPREHAGPQPGTDAAGTRSRRNAASTTISIVSPVWSFPTNCAGSIPKP
jgi:hypothetical protein